MPTKSLLLALTLLSLTATAFAAPATSIPQDPYSEGRRDASLQISKGQFNIQVMEMGIGNYDSPTAKVLRRYKINAFGGTCMPWPGQEEYDRGYNEVSKAAIEAKYGKNIWKRLVTQAKTALQKENRKGETTPIYNFIARWANEPTPAKPK